MTSLAKTSHLLSTYGRPRRTVVGRDGYERIIIGGKTKYVHRVVWEARHGPLAPGVRIGHKNGDRSDNRLDNLCISTGRRKGKKVRAWHPGGHVQERVFGSVKEAAEVLGGKPSGISRAMKRGWVAYGYMWREE